MNNTQTYVCEGCGSTYNGTPEEAFNLGWDTPERFMSHCTCPQCPIDRTAWWKVVMLKETLTPEEVERIRSYNNVYETAQQGQVS